MSIRGRTDRLNRKVRVGLIGLGAAARLYHLPAIQKNPGFEVAAGAEINEERCRRIAQLFHIPQTYGSYEEMLREAKPQAVYVCLPHHRHYPAVMAALRAGCHVMCEKPMGVSPEETEEMLAVAQKKGLVLYPGYNNRFVPNFREARRYFQEGLLGHLVQAQMVFMNPGPYIGSDPKSNWHFGEGSKGALYDIGCHALDLLQYITGSPLEVLSAAGRAAYRGSSAATNICCLLALNGQALGTLNLAWGPAALFFEVQLQGTGGTAVASYHEFRHYYAGTDPVEKVLDLLGLIGATVKKGILKGIHKMELDQIKLSANFLQTLLGREQPVTSAPDALETQKVMKKIWGLLKGEVIHGTHRQIQTRLD